MSANTGLDSSISLTTPGRRRRAAGSVKLPFILRFWARALLGGGVHMIAFSMFWLLVVRVLFLWLPVFSASRPINAPECAKVAFDAEEEIRLDRRVERAGVRRTFGDVG